MTLCTQETGVLRKCWVGLTASVFFSASWAEASLLSIAHCTTRFVSTGHRITGAQTDRTVHLVLLLGKPRHLRLHLEDRRRQFQISHNSKPGQRPYLIRVLCCCLVLLWRLRGAGHAELQSRSPCEGRGGGGERKRGCAPGGDGGQATHLERLQLETITECRSD